MYYCVYVRIDIFLLIMEKKYIILFVLIAIGSVVSCIPSFLSINLWQYIVGVIGFVIILMAIALFINKTSEDKKEIQGKDGEQTDKLGKVLKKINCSVNTFFSAFNSVGCALCFCVLLIVGIGVFDALMSSKIKPKDDAIINVVCPNCCRCMPIDSLKTSNMGNSK